MTGKGEGREREHIIISTNHNEKNLKKNLKKIRHYAIKKKRKRKEDLPCLQRK